MTVDPYAWVATAPVAGLAADCAAHILSVRLTRGDSRKRYVCVLAAFAVGLVVLVAATTAGLSAMHAPVRDSVALLLMNGAAYVGLGYGYFGFVNMNLTSLRIRILHEMVDAAGTMPKSTMHARYNTEQVIQVRIARLVAGGHLVEKEGRFYRGKATLLYIAATVCLMRGLVFGTQKPTFLPPPRA